MTINISWMVENPVLSIFYKNLRSHGIQFRIVNQDILAIKIGDLYSYFKLRQGKRTYFYLYNGIRRIRISIYDRPDSMLAKMINFTNFDFAPHENNKPTVNMTIVYDNIKDQIDELGLDDLKIKFIYLTYGNMRVTFQDYIEIHINNNISTRQLNAVISYPADYNIDIEKLNKLASYIKEYFSLIVRKFIVPKNSYIEAIHDGILV